MIDLTYFINIINKIIEYFKVNEWIAIVLLIAILIFGIILIISSISRMKNKEKRIKSEMKKSIEQLKKDGF